MGEASAPSAAAATGRDPVLSRVAGTGQRAGWGPVARTGPCVDPEAMPWSGLRESLAAATATPALRRLQLGWLLSSIGSWAFMVTLALYAFDRGGAAAVGLAAAARMIPAGIAAPFAGLLADRHGRRDVLLASTAARAGLVGVMALC